MLRFEMCVEFYKKGSTHRYMLLQVGAGRNVGTDFRFASETFAQHFKLMIHFGNRKKTYHKLWLQICTSLSHLLCGNYPHPYRHVPPPYWIENFYVIHTRFRAGHTPTALHFHPLMHTEVKEVFRLIAPRVNHFPHTHGTFQRNFTPKWQKNIIFTQMISYFLRI